MLPDDWNPIDSLAVLMLAVASADGDADRAELDAITQRLCQLAPKAPGRVDDAVRRALDHWFLQLIPGVERESAGWVSWHCQQLAERYPEKVRRRFVLDMVAISKASGSSQPAEIDLAAGIATTWGLDDLAQKMIEQFSVAWQQRSH